MLFGALPFAIMVFVARHFAMRSVFFYVSAGLIGAAMIAVMSYRMTRPCLLKRGSQHADRISDHAPDFRSRAFADLDVGIGAVSAFSQTQLPRRWKSFKVEVETDVIVARLWDK